MPLSPDSYTWLSSTPLAEAGCVTVVAAADSAAVRMAFGALSEPLSEHQHEQFEEKLVASETPDWAWFAAADSTDAAVVVEVNGFQGSRPEVLGPASRAGQTGKAASIFWNVNGMTIFTCARRGKILGSIDLDGLDDSDLDNIPRSLHRLARLGLSEDVDMVALGAAMVQQFTGVAFDFNVLRAGSARDLTPVPGDLPHYTADDPPFFLRDHPDLVEAVAALSGDRQRALAEWATSVAVAEAGLDREPAVALVMSQHGFVSPPVLNSGVEVIRGALDRRTTGIEHEWTASGMGGSVEGWFVHQQFRAIEAVCQSTHADALSAALGCAELAILTASLAITDRGHTYREDNTGRWQAETVNDAAPRGAAVASVLVQLAVSDREEWDQHTVALPKPLTADERAAAIARDREREARGDFRTYQTGRSH